jgi:hypothetical protein
VQRSNSATKEPPQRFHPVSRPALTPSNNSPVGTRRRSDEYRYNGKRVFLFSSDCCDQFNQVVDEQCNYICAPSGGITGKGDRKCTDFADKAELVKVVWKDER